MTTMPKTLETERHEGLVFSGRRCFKRAKRKESRNKQTSLPSQVISTQAYQVK